MRGDQMSFGYFCQDCGTSVDGEARCLSCEVEHLHAENQRLEKENEDFRTHGRSLEAAIDRMAGAALPPEIREKHMKEVGGPVPDYSVDFNEQKAATQVVERLNYLETEVSRLQNALNTDSQNLAISCLRETERLLRARLAAVRGIYTQIVHAIEQQKQRAQGGMQVPGGTLSHAPRSALDMLKRDLRHALEITDSGGKLTRAEACELARESRKRVDNLMAREVDRDALGSTDILEES